MFYSPAFWERVQSPWTPERITRISGMQCHAQWCLRAALLSLVVGERDSLRGHFEVHYGGGRERVDAQDLSGGLLHRLKPRQRLHLHRTQEPHVTGWKTGDHEIMRWTTDWLRLRCHYWTHLLPVWGAQLQSWWWTVRMRWQRPLEDLRRTTAHHQSLQHLPQSENKVIL